MVQLDSLQKCQPRRVSNRIWQPYMSWAFPAADQAAQECCLVTAQHESNNKWDDNTLNLQPAAAAASVCVQGGNVRMSSVRSGQGYCTWRGSRNHSTFTEERSSQVRSGLLQSNRQQHYTSYGVESSQVRSGLQLCIFMLVRSCQVKSGLQ